MNDLEDKIIVAAKELFIQKGFEQTGMSDIAVRVGINRTALHYYFRTKERMFQAVAGSIMAEVIPQARTIIAGDQPFFDKLESIIDMYMDLYRRNPDLLFFIFNESRRDINLIRSIIDSSTLVDYFHDILCMVEQEMASGRIKRIPLPYLAMRILSQVTIPFIAKPLVISANGLTEEAFDSFVFGWKNYMLSELRLALAPTPRNA